jgi:hypothetical protein
MTFRKMVVPIVVLALVASFGAPAAVAGKKKKPKPYKSEEHALAVAHTMLISSTGERNNVTLREFENRCEIPATQGLDAVVYEVPKEYQSIQSNITTGTTATQAYDLYFVMYDKDCQYKFVLGAAGSVTQANAEGVMPAGIAWVGIANFAGEPASVWWEAKP